ncbi:MAG: M16 family metallopeptidase [Candidatus Levyibacteriota bacterium]
MQYHKTVLENGLRVLVIPMPSFESATVMVMVGAGSRYENRKNSGISHFLEHMAFKGTEKRPSAIEISGLIDGIGGEFNAFTGKETTGYYVKAAATNVDLCLDLLSDMLQNSLLDEGEIEKEKGVITEEMNMYEDTPARKLGDVYENLLYGDTPMGWDIVGTKEVIRSINRTDFTNYMQSLYSPHNMTVVVSGGVTEAVVEKVKAYFGQMKRFDIIKAEKVIENQEKAAFLLKKKQTEQVHFGIGFRTIALSHNDRYPLDVLSAILGGGMSSRLFHEIREKRGLAYYVRSMSENNSDCGTFVSTAGVDPNRATEAVKVMMEEYAKIAKPGNITASELTKAKEYIKGHFVLDLEDSRSVAGMYAAQELLEKEIENPEYTIQKIDAVTLDEVHHVATTYFVEGTLNMAIIGNFDNGQQFEDLLKL